MYRYITNLEAKVKICEKNDDVIIVRYHFRDRKFWDESPPIYPGKN